MRAFDQVEEALKLALYPTVEGDKIRSEALSALRGAIVTSGVGLSALETAREALSRMVNCKLSPDAPLWFDVARVQMRQAEKALAVVNALIINATLQPKPVTVPSAWISVADRLPEPGVRVLTWLAGVCNCVEIDMVHDHGGDGSHESHGLHFGFEGVTHWQPLPEPPVGGRP